VRDHGAGRVRVALALAGAALCLVPGIVAALPAQAALARSSSAAGTAAIRGVVLLGVAHAPVPGATVTLHGAGSRAGPTGRTRSPPSTPA